MTLLSRAKKEALDLLFPPLCFGCKTEGTFLCEPCKTTLRWIPPTCFVCGAFRPPKKRVPAGRTCSLCRKKTHIYAFFSPFSYSQDLVREQIHALKYNRVRSLDAALAGLMKEYFDTYRINLPKNAIIVPIPLYKSRERTRGFNQSERIAQRLQDMLNLEVRSDILQKTKQTKPQIELTASERRQNVVGTFTVNHPDAVNPVRDLIRLETRDKKRTTPGDGDTQILPSRISNGVKNKTVILLDDVKTTGATLEEAARVLKDAEAKKIWAIAVAH